MPSWLDHKELKIIRGIYQTPNITRIVEAQPVTLNLMASGQSGITLASDGWSPNVPQIKNSGVWADSPINDGRRLISGVNANVTESIHCTITGGSFTEVAGFLSQLRQMQNDARDFWQGSSQIDPVYLKWWAVCGAGPQYALIFNMDFVPTYVDSPKPTIDVVISIERECFWRSIAPGANPKTWRYEFYGQSQAFTVVQSDVSTGTDNLVAQTALNNRSEFNDANLSTLRSNNCITIDGSLIPGDAPALMLLSTPAIASYRNFVMGKKTRKINQSVAGTVAEIQNAVLNGADASLKTDATLANDTGAVKSATGVNAQRVEVSFATATNACRLGFSTNLNRLIGRWAVYMRCRQSAGTVGDVTMYLRYGPSAFVDTDGIKMNVVNPPTPAGGTGNSTNWGLVYMGVMELPIMNAKGSVGQGGTGQNTGGLNYTQIFDLTIGLYALRSAGVGLLYISDLILIPMDEGSFTLESGDANPNAGMYYDDTGFLSHGLTDTFVINGDPGTSSAQLLAKLTGPGIQLTPNVENKLYFAFYGTTGLSDTGSSSGITANFFINIVPRWQGIRGV